MADRVVPIAKAANEIVARMAAGLIEEAGLHCMVKNIGAGMAYAAPALDPHQILVLEDDVPQAATILVPYVGAELTLLVAAPDLPDSQQASELT